MAAGRSPAPKNCLYVQYDAVTVTVVNVLGVLVGVAQALHEAKNVAEVVWQMKKGTWASAQR
jgi:hypothetical protein